jgi:4-amino-4-deoxy-L-arabinose transferase-like glycosyltransferase
MPALNASPSIALLVEPARRSWLVLIVAIALPVVAAFAPRDLWSPDEPRYALVARGMLESGDFVVPRLNGEAYAEKPPLGFAWMAAAGAVAGRASAVTSRLPCALLAALAVLMTARLARRWFGDPGLGDTAALLFSTAGLVLWNSSRAALDLPMTTCVLVALDAGTTVVVRRSLWAALAFGAALGAGLLTKGPHALYVPIAALVGGCAAVGKPRRLRDPRWLAGLALALGIALAWLLLALSRAGDEAAYGAASPRFTYGQRILGQLGSRLTGENEPHDHGPFYLLGVLLAAALPWTPAWILALPRALRPSRAPEEDRFGLGAAAWGLIAPLVLLSIPSTQRELYLIPLLPCAAILAAYAFHRVATDGAAGGLARWLVSFGAITAVAGFALPFVAAQGSLGLVGDDPTLAQVVADSGLAFATGAAAFLIAAGAAVAWRLRENASGAARATGVALAAAWIVVATAVLPAFDRWKSLASAADVAAREAPGLPLSIWGFSDASVLWSFPNRRLIRLGEIGYPEAAAALQSSATPALVLAREKVWRERGGRATVAENAVFDRARILWQRPVSGTSYLLLTNAPR